MYDVIVIGKGPAGISAAIYTIRANKKTLVISKDYGWLAKADKVENYYGFEDAISGMDLLEAGIKQAKKLGVEFVDAEVVSMENYDGFKVKTTKGEFSSKSLVIATGMPRKKSKIKNLVDFEGRGVGYCAICDAFFYRNKKVGITGNSDYAYGEAKELLNFTKDLTVYTNGRDYVGTNPPSIDFDKNIKLDTRKIDHLEGGEKLEKIVFEDGTFDLVDGFFVAEGTAGAMEFALKLGLENDGKNIIVEKGQKTNIPGLFAAGDCVGGILQISVAVGEGAVAGLSAISYLKSLNKS